MERDAVMGKSHSENAGRQFRRGMRVRVEVRFRLRVRAGFRVNVRVRVGVVRERERERETFFILSLRNVRGTSSWRNFNLRWKEDTKEGFKRLIQTLTITLTLTLTPTTTEVKIKDLTASSKSFGLTLYWSI
jgi:hypothetical protein